MDNKYSLLFSSGEGEALYSKVENTIRAYGMKEKIEGGVLLGLSGGADSVFLALVLIEYRRRSGLTFPILAVHVNHLIRGEEAERDAQFSEQLARELGMEFICRKIDVPRFAEESALGLEEAARIKRYSIFDDIIKGRNDINAIAVAHNASDSAETVLFNLTRGTGLAGAAGISPVRGSIVRPLISLSKNQIRALLDNASIKYVIDSTNESVDYTRNYIRHEIIPRLENLNPRCEDAIFSFSSSVRGALEYLDGDADRVLSGTLGGVLPKERIASLPDALFARVLIKFAESYGIRSLARCHVLAIQRLMSGDNFRYSVSSGYEFVCERGRCSFVKKTAAVSPELNKVLSPGMNSLDGYSGYIHLGDISEISLNVYKTAIYADLSSAIIVGGLYCRFKLDGDAYFYGGMTHKLKKVFNDRGIPPSRRTKIPVICDDNGIVWVPGLGVRDDHVDKSARVPRYISFLLPQDACGEEIFAASATDADN